MRADLNKSVHSPDDPEPRAFARATRRPRGVTAGARDDLSTAERFEALSARQPEIALLRRFIEAYWLRPENAFWMYLRSAVLSRRALDGPMLDVACGDGVFSFLHAGGAFDPAFDVFAAVTNLDRVHDAHADMFDCSGAAYRPVVVHEPDRTIACGLDAKVSLLDRAALLELYDRLIRHDCARPLPIPNGAFQTVYCNAAYWVENIDAFLRELHRITSPGGRVILHVKLDSLGRYTLESHRAALGDRFLDIIGRGRVETWPSLADRATWERRFEAAQLAIDEATPFITKTHAHVWDIGLRPIAPLLVRMANALSPETRIAIKRDWVALMVDLLAPLCDPRFDLIGSDDEPGEIHYVLRPRT